MKKWLGMVAAILVFPWLVSLVWMGLAGESRAAAADVIEETGTAAVGDDAGEETGEVSAWIVGDEIGKVVAGFPVVGEGMGETAAQAAGSANARKQPKILVVRDDIRTYIPLEDYLAGVIVCQIDPEYEPEALKCQAIIARTYLYRLLDGRTEIQEEELDLDYLEEGKRTRNWDMEKVAGYLKRCQEAVKATESVVMLYEERPVLPMFHGMNSGRTRQGDEAYPYLQSVESRWDTACEGYSRTFTWEPEAFAEKLNGVAEGADLRGDQVLGEIQVVKKDDAGYVRQLQIKARTYPAETVQHALELPSCCFTLSSQDGKISAVVKGQGHGYGLSQAGADAMAKEGWGYEDILNYYYKNISFISE